jgi:DNA-binding CsgD family transcriptional regulator
LGTEERDRPLAGLVSDEAEALYARLLEAGSLEIGPGPDQVDIDSAPAMELRQKRIAYRSTVTGDDVRPVAQATAVQLLLDGYHDEIIQRHQRAAAGWKLLDSLMSNAADLRTSKSPRADSPVELVSGRDELNQLSVELYEGTRKELLGLSTATFTVPLKDDSLLAPSQHILDRGCRFRMIYDSAYAADRVGRRIIERSVAAGEQAKIRETLPLKMLHVDNIIALVALTDTGMNGSLLVRSPNLLAALREWFELMWNDPTSTVVGDPQGVALSAAQRNVLALLASGLSDDAIARATGMSVRTVRRHISAILEMLGVNSRFVAGAMAAKRGWI